MLDKDSNSKKSYNINVEYEFRTTTNIAGKLIHKCST